LSLRYIGSKTRVIKELAKYIGEPSSDDGRFVDAFCGTGVVSQQAAEMGWPIWINDHLLSAVTISSARVISKKTINFNKIGGYEIAIEYLNNLPTRKGFIWKEYSPASINFSGIERKYFSEENAGLIDAIRHQIFVWEAENYISQIEKTLLIADLLSATNSVANIAGTYGCFLSKWSNQAFQRLRLIPRELFLKPVRVQTSCDDVNNLLTNSNDLVYLDPPYTKRQYASYYHILETITLGDNPIVEGVSGLRPWKEKASDFCYKKRALPALKKLISQMDAKRILLSYSNAGHIQLNDLTAELKSIGIVNKYELMDIGQYRPNKTASNNHSSVKEFLISVEK
jgi:adenine-specific DNA-methyltransferase